MKEFEAVRNWGKIRGIEGADPQVQYQRFLQEAVEIHEAMIESDRDEFRDAIGDTIVTLIMLAKTMDEQAEDCLQEAFNVIRYRKGLNKNGSFVRYGKLNDTEKAMCDNQQGSAGDEYFSGEAEFTLTPEDFLP